jgi:predicted N-acyltransferase
MRDCEPVYLLAYRDDALIGRASLWVIRNEPLPIGPGVGRAVVQAFLRYRPLLICRSPLSNASGLILPPEPSRAETLRAIAESALAASKQRRCSFLLFDFLSAEESRRWPEGFSLFTVSDPGMRMQNRWPSLEAYLADGNKKDRQHYKRTLREAAKLGVTIEKRTRVEDVPAALDLIQKVDRRYKNAPHPWMRGLLENLEMANGAWLEARQNGRLVGCGASFEDNEAQLATALGLEEDIPYAYLLLTYASLEEAIQKRVRVLRWGSGAYEVKKQLGFETEDNAHIRFSSRYALFNYLAKIFS